MMLSVTREIALFFFILKNDGMGDLHKHRSLGVYFIYGCALAEN